jgi:integrase/recombinase XerD
MKKLKDKRLFENISSFLLVYLPRIRNKSDCTVVSYRITLKLFIQFFEQAKNITVFDLTTTMITRDSIVEFLDWLSSERNCSASTRNNRLSCLRTFYKYVATHCDPSLSAMMNGIAEIRKAQVVKDLPPVVLTEQEVALVLAAPDTNTRIGIRDRFYLTMMYDSGGRSDEILSLKLQNITITGKTSKIHIVGKGGKSRIIPISEKATAMMRHYLKIFHSAQDRSQYLFYIERDNMKRKMSADNAARIMEKYESKVKQEHTELPHLHPHLWRHTRAQNLYSAGMPLPLISEWLGHSKMETSLIYAHADVDMKRKAIEKATSGANMLVQKEAPIFLQDEDIIKRLYGIC